MPMFSHPEWVNDLSQNPPVMENSSVFLRPFTNADTHVFVEAGTDPNIYEVFCTVEKGCDTDQAVSTIKVLRRRTAEHGIAYAIADVETNRAVGYLKISTSNLSKGRVVLGIWTSPLRRDKGHMSDAVQMAVRWLFSLEGVFRVEATVAPWNVASQRVFEKCGFQREAFILSYELREGVPQDMYLYGLVTRTP